MNEATVPTTEPICPGSPSLRCITANEAIPPSSKATPTPEATSRPMLPFPTVARMTRATTGRKSFMNTFHTKVTRTARAIAESGKPHDRNMA